MEAYVATEPPYMGPLVLIFSQTAGLTLAARLSEDPNVSVLVLEAGEANIGLQELREPFCDVVSSSANPISMYSTPSCFRHPTE